MLTILLIISSKKKSQEARFNDFRFLPPESEKTIPWSFDLVTFWPWLQKATKAVPGDSIWWVLAPAPEVDRTSPKILDLMTFWPWLQPCRIAMRASSWPCSLPGGRIYAVEPAWLNSPPPLSCKCKTIGKTKKPKETEAYPTNTDENHWENQKKPKKQRIPKQSTVLNLGTSGPCLWIAWRSLVFLVLFGFPNGFHQFLCHMLWLLWFCLVFPMVFTCFRWACLGFFVH